MIPPLFALFAWQALVPLMFSRFTARTAVLVALLGGYLFLPETTRFDLPGLPGLDKDRMTALAVAVVAAVSATGRQSVLPGWLPKSALVRLLLVLLPTMAVATSLTNTDPLVYGPVFLQGLPLWESASVLAHILLFILPLLIGRRYLADPEGQRALLMALAIAGLGYSLLALWEVRMSPQLHRKVYGFFQHDWRQHIRDGGFRPIVFLQHGLWVALFLSTACLSTLTLVRANPARKTLWLVGGGWLLGTIVLTKSLGALVVTLLLAPLLLLTSRRTQVLAAAVVAGIVVTYPLLRGAGVIPVDTVVRQAAAIDEGRAASLQYRLNTEELLLEKTERRPLFGWGRFGRNFVFDPETGKRLTVADGYWIIRVSQSGWLGYIAEFGLLCGALVLLSMNAGRIGLDAATAGLSLVLAGNIIDLIPNATLTPITWLMVGALYGRLEYGAQRVPSGAVATASGPARPVYRRSDGPEADEAPLPGMEGMTGGPALSRFGAKTTPPDRTRATRPVRHYHRPRDGEA